MTRTSMTLDRITLTAMETLSKKWDISKAEVVRRGVALLKQKADEEEAMPSPLEAFDWLQKSGGMLAEDAAQYKADLKSERDATKYWWEP